MTLATVRRSIIQVVVGIGEAIEALGLFTFGAAALILASFYTYVLGTAWLQSLTVLQPVQYYVALVVLSVAVAAIYFAGGWFIFELRNTDLAARLS